LGSLGFSYIGIILRDSDQGEDGYNYYHNYKLN
jgi:hypothetical protein